MFIPKPISIKIHRIHWNSLPINNFIMNHICIGSFNEIFQITGHGSWYTCCSSLHMLVVYFAVRLYDAIYCDADFSGIYGTWIME